MNRYRVTSYAGPSVEVSASTILEAREKAKLGRNVTVTRLSPQSQRCVDCGVSYDDAGKAQRGMPPLCGPCFTGRLISGKE